MFFPPFLLMFLFGFIFLLFFVFALVQFGLFAWAFSRLGIPPEYLFSFMFLCIAGSMINIPIRKIRLEDEPEEWKTIHFYGMRFRPPRWANPREMVVAVNLEINYKQPVPLGQKIVIVARVKEILARKVLTTGEMLLPDGSVAVTGRGIYVPAPHLVGKVELKKSERADQAG